MPKTYQPSEKIPSSEITPEKHYYTRRQFIQLAAAAGAAAALTACGVRPPESEPLPNASTAPSTSPSTAGGSEEKLTSYEDVTTFNNFYEFGLDKGDPAKNAGKLQTSPWTVEVYGLVNQPRTFAIEDLLSGYTQEERIYRMRCVEGWSMVIPWQGFTLSQLLKAVEPTAEAKYVRFETLYRPEEMPFQSYKGFPWPYQEGLRLDEAMHDLTILSTGLYGQTLLPQNGAPLRLVVPWKYGFKSIKSIVKIELVAEQPATLWNTTAPREYGFYSNVNPDVPHPRWSQASERRIGEGGRRPTLLFNGYEKEVAGLYAGMDLRANY